MRRPDLEDIDAVIAVVLAAIFLIICATALRTFVL